MAKAPSQKPEYRLTLYLPPEDREALKELGMKLHKAGEPGILNRKGEVVQSAVIRWLIQNPKI